MNDAITIVRDGDLSNFVGTRVVDGYGRTGGDAWIVHSIRVGGKSLLTGPVPGSRFGPGSSPFHLFHVNIQPSDTFQMEVEYVGVRPEGAVFRASGIGLIANGSGRDGTMVVAPTPGPPSHIVRLECGPVLPGMRAIATARPSPEVFFLDRIVTPEEQTAHLYLSIDGWIYDFTGGGPYGGADVRVLIMDASISSHIITRCEPRVLTFYHQSNDLTRASLLWAVDDASSRVVFEAGTFLAGEPVAVAAYEHFLRHSVAEHWSGGAVTVTRRNVVRLDLDGFTPEWMARLETEGGLVVREPAPAPSPTHAEIKQTAREDALQGWKTR